MPAVPGHRKESEGRVGMSLAPAKYRREPKTHEEVVSELRSRGSSIFCEVSNDTAIVVFPDWTPIFIRVVGVKKTRITIDDAYSEARKVNDKEATNET